MKKSFVLSLLIGGLLFSCNGENTSEIDNKQEGPSNPPQTVEENEQGLAFYLLDDGTYGVGAGYSIHLSTVVIPPTYKGKAVTKIVDYGFDVERNNGMEIKNIVMPDSIVEIGYLGIQSDEIESLTLSKNLAKINSNGISIFNTLKEVKYPGTYEEFNKIEFCTNWLKPNGYNVDNDITFIFKDKTMLFTEAFDHVVLGSHYYDDDSNEALKTYDKVTIQAYKVRQESYLGCYYETTGFGKIVKKAYRLEIEVENSEIIEASLSNETLIYKPKKIAGTTKITFTDGIISTDITFDITPDIPITVKELLSKEPDFDMLYTMTVHWVNCGIKHVDTYFTFYEGYIKDSLDDDEQLACIYTSQNGEEVPENLKVRLSGVSFFRDDSEIRIYDVIDLVFLDLD